jgi:p21-activated kinase 1
MGKILKTSGIGKRDVVSNPQAALAAMNFIQNQTVPTVEVDTADQTDGVIKKENLLNFLTNMTKINEGSTFTVYTATLDDKVIAVKEMILNPKNKKILLDETKLMASMKSENIIEFYGAYKGGQMLWILMEYLDGGSLTNIATFCECQEPHIAFFAREILKAIKYMHGKTKFTGTLKQTIFY